MNSKSSTHDLVRGQHMYPAHVISCELGHFRCSVTKSGVKGHSSAHYSHDPVNAHWFSGAI